MEIWRGLSFYFFTATWVLVILGSVAKGVALSNFLNGTMCGHIPPEQVIGSVIADGAYATYLGVPQSNWC
ncbi:MAG: hypothetical protein KDE08_15815 [Rhodobacteraceae bacterium]|nr:hypothetical protein [Paracoccaceae bacterium]